MCERRFYCFKRNKGYYSFHLLFFNSGKLGIFCSDANWEYRVIRSAIRLANTLSICKEKYRVKIGDTPLLSCAICGQEIHKSCISTLLGDNIPMENLEQIYNPHKLPGIFYICEPCADIKIPQKETAWVKKSKEVGNQTN